MFLGLGPLTYFLISQYFFPQKIALILIYKVYIREPWFKGDISNPLHLPQGNIQYRPKPDGKEKLCIIKKKKPPKQIQTKKKPDCLQETQN
jgi:hypothetical protein